MRWISLLLIIVPTIYFGYAGKPTEMGLAIVAGSLASAFLNLDRFTRVKGAGVELEMKEVIKEAYATIDSLKSVAKSLCDYSLFQLTYGDRFMPNTVKKIEHQEKIISLAKEIEVYTDSYKKQECNFFLLMSWDLYREILHTINSDDQFEESSKVIEKLEEIEDRGTTNFPSKQIIENIFIKNDMEIERETRRLIDIYSHYIKYKKLGKPD